MKRFRRLAALLLSALMLLSMTACSAVSDQLLEDEIIALVQGNLDTIYLGKFDESYIKSTNSSEEECLQVYEDGLDIEADYFAAYFGIEYFTDDLRAKVVDLYREIYSHSNYTVGAASRLDETTVVVKVDIQPIDLFIQFAEQADTLLADFRAKYTQDVVAAMTEAEYVAYDAEWANLVIDTCRSLLPTLSYEETSSVAIQVVLADDVWSIDTESMGDIDAEIIAYP